MAPHKPRKPAPVEYITHEENMIVYDIEEVETTKSIDWWCRAGRGNAVKTRRVDQAVVNWPLPKNYSSRSYESSLDGAASECSNK
ncbi:hypothetical protein TNCV_4705881 [Trichonephila clavipes]|nr:hypothetical protein TNCV_4705881 [Trichonephila clavipes]